MVIHLNTVDNKPLISTSAEKIYLNGVHSPSLRKILSQDVYRYLCQTSLQTFAKEVP